MVRAPAARTIRRYERGLRGVMRLRVGILLWALSWVPYGVILGLEGAWYAVAWTVEIALGLIGLAICGTELAGVIKRSGWRRTPSIAWHVLVHGSTP